MGGNNVDASEFDVAYKINEKIAHHVGDTARRDFTVYNQSRKDMWFRCDGDWKHIAKRGGHANRSIKHDIPARVAVSNSHNGTILRERNCGNSYASNKVLRCYWDGNLLQTKYVPPQ